MSGRTGFFMSGITSDDDDDFDVITRPQHYTDRVHEPIEVIEDWELGFNLGNCVKYIARCELKGNPIQDLEKGAYYLNREISRRKEERVNDGS